MAKQIPILQINSFHKPAVHSPAFYVELFEAHIARYQFIRTPHRHDFYCLFLFTQGAGTHTIDFVEYVVKPGSMFFMSPAQVHTWDLPADTFGYVVFFTAEFYLLEYNQKKLSDFPFFHSLTSFPFVHLEDKQVDLVTEIVTRIFEQYQGKEAGRESIIRAYLHILLLTLSNFYDQASNPTLPSHVTQQIRQLEILVEKHYLEHKPINEYAQLMHMSARHLSAICQKGLHKSLGTVLQERMLLEAKRLLVHTDLSVAQIAGQLNFMNNSYFNRFFKKTAGITPENFRRQFR